MVEQLGVFSKLQSKAEHIRVALGTPRVLEGKVITWEEKLDNMPAGAGYLDRVIEFGVNKQRIQRTVDTFTNQARPILARRLADTEQHIQDIERARGQLDQVAQLHQQGIITDRQLDKARQSAAAVELEKLRFLSAPKQKSKSFIMMPPGIRQVRFLSAEEIAADSRGKKTSRKNPD